MTDWQAVACALQAPIHPEDRAPVIAPLEKLERAFHPLQENVPLDTPLWGGPIESGPIESGPTHSTPIHSTKAQPE